MLHLHLRWLPENLGAYLIAAANEENNLPVFVGASNGLLHVKLSMPALTQTQEANELDAEVERKADSAMQAIYGYIKLSRR